MPHTVLCIYELYPMHQNSVVCGLNNGNTVRQHEQLWNSIGDVEVTSPPPLPIATTHTQPPCLPPRHAGSAAFSTGGGSQAEKGAGSAAAEAGGEKQ